MASLLLILLGLVITGIVWRKLLVLLGYALDQRIGAKIFFVGQLGKYIPGSLWSLGAQAEMAKVAKVPARITVANGLVFLYWNVATAGLIAALALAFNWIDWGISPLVPLFAVVLALLALTPVSTNFVTGLLAGRQAPRESSVKSMSVIASLMTVVWLLYGTSLYLLLPVTLLQNLKLLLLLSLGTFCLSYAIGVLAVFAPAGIGVREAVIVSALSPLLGTPSALAVAVLIRVLHTFGDFLLAFASWLSCRIYEQRTK